MMRNIECIADVLGLIAGSARLLAAMSEKGIDRFLKEDETLTRFGWFRDHDGTMRWRIDLVDDKQVHMQPIHLGTGYASVPDGNEDVDDHDIRDNESPYRLSVDIPVARHSILHGTAHSLVA